MSSDLQQHPDTGSIVHHISPSLPLRFDYLLGIVYKHRTAIVAATFDEISILLQSRIEDILCGFCRK